jgi:MFS transporter, Spinster family, sphingosine-1-phosphate transporter
VGTQTSRYRGVLLGTLLTILAFNYVDRLAFGLVLQDIKDDLDLSDTQLGLLSGFAFAVFYSVMGVPIARWADRGNRVTIITITTALWSAAVALLGAATSFVHLLLIRVGIAVGEAGCIPPAHSLIADHFSRTERPRAVAIYMLGKPLSMVIGYLLAGWINELYGWRMTFMFLGLPGLALAVWAAWVLKEPRRDSSLSSSVRVASHAMPASLWTVCTTLWSRAAFRHLLFCFALATFFNYGVGQWQPAFFIRSFGFETGELGTWFAFIWGGGGLLGTYLGGMLASRYAARNERLQLKATSAMYASFALVSTLTYLCPNAYLALGLMAIAAVGGYMINAPLFATIQTLVPEHMRAQSIALIYLCANFVGMGLGPLAAGALSDLFQPWAGGESLRYALLVLCPGYAWAGWHLWRASTTVMRDLEVANATAR